MTTTKRVDWAERRIAASPEATYQAFIDREAVARWLPPAGSRATIEEFDPRPGGVFRMRLVFDGPGVTGKTDEHSDVVIGSFEELSPGRSVTQRFEFQSDDPKYAGAMTMRWMLEQDGGGTRVRVEAENVPAGIDPEAHERGMTSSLANLARLLGDPAG